MEEKKLVVKYDERTMRRMGLVVLGMSVAVLIIGILAFFYRTKNPDYLYFAVFALICFGLAFVGARYLIKAANPVIFTVKGDSVYFNSRFGKVALKDIDAVAATASFGKKDGVDVELAALEPPVPHRTGDLIVSVKTINRQFKFSAVENVFEIMEFMKENVPDWQFMLWKGQQRVDYEYWDLPEDELAEKKAALHKLAEPESDDSAQ